eukprot:jgi/Galph1/2662/GphlegSOOS_G1367.1
METSNLCDRTREFLSAAQSCQLVGISTPPSNKRKPLTTRSEFTQQAINVAKGIESVSQTLIKLTKLCQKTGLFDDASVEIQQLTFLVKQQLHALNKQLEELEHLHQQKKSIFQKQAISHHESVVETLKTDLMKTTKEFKQERRSQFVGNESDGVADWQEEVNSSLASIERPNNSSLVLDLGSGSLGHFNGNMYHNERVHNEPQDSSQLSTQMQSIRLDNSYQRERAEAAQQIESTIVELGQIFQQLATMVSEQGELVERIDSNIEDTMFQVEQGQNQLLRYYNRISSNRWLIVKVFATLILFLFLWVVIL